MSIEDIRSFTNDIMQELSESIKESKAQERKCAADREYGMASHHSSAALVFDIAALIVRQKLMKAEQSSSSSQSTPTYEETFTDMREGIANYVSNTKQESVGSSDDANLYYIKPLEWFNTSANTHIAPNNLSISEVYNDGHGWVWCFNFLKEYKVRCCPCASLEDGIEKCQRRHDAELKKHLMVASVK